MRPYAGVTVLRSNSKGSQSQATIYQGPVFVWLLVKQTRILPIGIQLKTCKNGYIHFADLIIFVVFCHLIGFSSSSFLRFELILITTEDYSSWASFLNHKTEAFTKAYFVADSILHLSHPSFITVYAAKFYSVVSFIHNCLCSSNTLCIFLHLKQSV